MLLWQRFQPWHGVCSVVCFFFFASFNIDLIQFSHLSNVVSLISFSFCLLLQFFNTSVVCYLVDALLELELHAITLFWLTFPLHCAHNLFGAQHTVLSETIVDNTKMLVAAV